MFRKFLIISSILVSGISNAQIGPVGPGDGIILQPQLGVVLDFLTGNPATQTCTTAPNGGLMDLGTYTRGTTAYNDWGSDLPSSITQCSSGNARFNLRGYIAEPQTFNEVTQSETMDNAAWAAANVTVTANSTTAPNGTVTAETLAGTANGGLITSTAVVSANSIYTASVYAKVASGTQAFDLVYFDNTGSTTRCSVTGGVATTQWQRFQCTDTTAVTVSHNLLLRIYPGQTTGTGTIIAWGAQLEVSNYATTYAPTTTVRLAHNTDVLWFQNPMGTTELNSGYGWCVATDYTPPPTTNDWALAALTQGLWEMSSGTHNTANNAEAYVKSAGTMSLDVRDTTNTIRTFNVTKPSTGKHRVAWCIDQTGTTGVTMYLDGASQSVSNTGTGTAIQSAMPTRLYYGILTSSSAAGGTVANLKVSRYHTVGASL